MRNFTVLFALVWLTGCWRDSAAVGAQYESAWLAAHPDDAALGDADAGFDAQGTDATAGSDAVDAAADVPDAVSPCADKVCVKKGDCWTAVCDAKTGNCLDNPLPDTTVCSDGDACTLGDSCKAGTCAGKPAVCNDSNACTTDSCDAALGCQYLPNSATCTDSSACTSGDGCVAGKCQTTPVVCEDNNPCTNNNCDPTSGCVYPPNTATCTDNDACSEPDVCANTVCGGIKVDCDDANSCTIDTCDKLTGCVHAALTGACDDGNPCTLPDMCVAGVCSGGAFAFGLHPLEGGTYDTAWDAASSGGSSWIVGASASGLGAQSDFSLWSIGADGGIAGQRTVGEAVLSEVGRIAVPASGGVWAIGDASAATGGQIPSFAWFGDDLSTGAYKFATTDQSWRITGQRMLGAQWLLTGNRQQTGAPLHGWFGVATVKTGSAPSVVVTSEWLSSSAQASRIDALVALTGGTFLGIGAMANPAGGEDLWLVRIAATGDYTADSALDIGAGQHRVLSALPTADGGALVLAMAEDVSPGTLLLLQLDKTLTVAWQLPVGVDLWQNAALVAGAPGAYVVGTRADTLDRGAVLHVSPQGQIEWSFTSPLGALPQRLSAALLQPDGRLVAYGWQGALDADVLELALDPWGSASCTTTGKCSSLANTPTDDGNACTLDKCDPTLGIVHTNVADGSWCDDGVACTVGDACISGTCFGGPRLFTKNFSGRTLYHLEPLSEGGFVLCGSTNDAIGSSYITWVDAAGEQKLDHLALGTTALPGHGCAQGADDAIWQVGWSGAGNPLGARVRKFDLATQSDIFDQSYGGVQFSAIVAHPAGGVVALGSNQPQPRATRILADGSKGWDWLGAGVGNADNANAGVFLSDGSLLVVGEKHASNATPSAFAVRLDATGAAVWTQNFSGITGRLLGVGIQRDGSLVAVGGQGTGGSSAPWIVRLDFASGAVKDTFSPPAPQGTVWYDVAFFASGGKGPGSDYAFLVGGSANQAIYARVAVDAYAGKPDSLTAANQGSAPAFRSVVLDPSGDVLIAGNTTQAQLTRFDPWYHQTCTSAGKCLGWAPIACDDGNACTQDGCDGTLGCTYTNTPPNQPCQGGGMCQNGVCK